MVVRDLMLYKVKAPAESKGAFDFYQYVSRVKGEQTVRPLNESECGMVKK
jgi:branched-chain amino acid transport system substrate-binding protein